MAGPAVDDVEAIVVGRGVQNVVSRPAVLDVGSTTHPHRVVSFAAVLDVVALASLDHVAAAPA